MREIPKPFEQFMHFKGKRYQVLQIAIHSETREKLVIYQALYGDYLTYARPLDMFLSEVDHAKYPLVKQKYRFTRIVGGKLVEEEGEPAPNANNGAAEMVQPETEAVKKEVPYLKVNTQEAREQREVIHVEEKVQKPAQTELTEEEQKLDPLLIEFLDADTTEKRINILTALHGRITHEMMNTIAIVMDLEVPDGDIEERYQQIRFALQTKKKYERTR